jgi:hypothetical protein
VRLPRTLTINGERWRVVRKPMLHRGLFGQCVPSLREIQICSWLTGDDLADTFLHEVLHACMGPGWKEEDEEAVVSRLAPKLLRVLDSIGWAKR